VGQLYSQALGSIFVASYDSQGYGGGILTRLHTGLLKLNECLALRMPVTYTLPVSLDIGAVILRADRLDGRSLEDLHSE
jgi:hypothetical protein